MCEVLITSISALKMFYKLRGGGYAAENTRHKDLLGGRTYSTHPQEIDFLATCYKNNTELILQKTNRFVHAMVRHNDVCLACTLLYFLAVVCYVHQLRFEPVDEGTESDAALPRR